MPLASICDAMRPLTALRLVSRMTRLPVCRASSWRSSSVSAVCFFSDSVPSRCDSKAMGIECHCSNRS